MNDQALVQHNQDEVVTNGNDAMTAIFERAAFDIEFPLDRLEKMMEMQERWQANQSEKEFNEALAAAQSEMPVVLKNQENSMTRSTYADLAAINKAIAPVYSAHGFSVSFNTFEAKMQNCYGVSCELCHRSGHRRKFQAEIPPDNVGIKGNTNKTSIHAFGSTMSYAKRYLLTMIFNIATEDPDGSINQEADKGGVTQGNDGRSLEQQTHDVIEALRTATSPEQLNERLNHGGTKRLMKSLESNGWVNALEAIRTAHAETSSKLLDKSIGAQ